MDQQRLLEQPADELLAVRRVEHRLQRVATPQRPVRIEVMCEQVQVVVAEHRAGVGPQRAHQPQRLERLGAAVDQVADELQPVAIG